MSHVLLLHVGNSSKNTHLIDVLSIDLADIVWAGNTILDHLHCDWGKDLELSTSTSFCLVLSASKGSKVASLGETCACIVIGLEETC